MTDRLRRSRDVRAVLRHGRVHHGRHLVARVARRTGDGPARVALVAGRRVGGAVERNRAKRRLRAAARETDLAEGADVVLIARPSAAHAPYHELCDDLRALTARGRSAREVEVSSS